MGTDEQERDLLDEQDLAFEHRQYRVQRTCWWLSLAVVTGTLAGVFGKGPLSGAEAVSANAELAVRYQRICRDKSPDELRFSFRPAAGSSEGTILAISAEYLSALDVRGIMPPPNRSEIAGHEVFFYFAAGPSSAVHDVVMRFKHDQAGVIEGAARFPNRPGSDVIIRQYVLP